MKTMKVIYSEHYLHKNHTDILDDYYRLYIASVIRRNMISEEFVEFMLAVFKPPNVSYEELCITEDDIIAYIEHYIKDFIMDNRGLPNLYFDKKVLELIGVKVTIEDNTLRVTMTF